MREDPFEKEIFKEDNHDDLDKEESPPLWNPNAAGMWSLLFTPIFGSILLLKNWQALGDKENISKAKMWLLLSIVMIVPTFLIPMFGLVYIIIWYYAWQSKQTKYIKDRWGKKYNKKSWLIPLLIGFTVIFSPYFFLLTLH